MKLGTMSGAQQGIMLSDLLRDYHQDRSQLDPPARGLRTPMNTASASYMGLLELTVKERIRRIVEGHNHHPAQKILRRHLEIYPDTKYKAVVTLAILHCGDVYDFLSHYYGLNPLPAIPIGPTNESAEPVGWVLSAPASSSFQTLATAWHAHGTHSAI